MNSDLFTKRFVTLNLCSQLATQLLEKEVLTHKDVEKLIGPPPFGRKNLVEMEVEVEAVEESVKEPPIEQATAA